MTTILPIHLTHPPILTPNPTPNLTPPSQTGLQFHQKIQYLESLQINSLKALTLNPLLRTTSLQTLLTLEQTLLTTFSLPRTSLGRILDSFPTLLTTPPSSLPPIAHFLVTDASLPTSHLPRAILRCPRLLTAPLDSQLRPTLLFLRTRLNFTRFTPHTALLLVSDVNRTLIPKIEYLIGLGFEENVVVKMINRSPALLTYSVEKNLVPKVRFFVEVMKGDLEEIRNFPQYFSFSLDGRIVPRFRVLEEFGVKMSLKDMLTVSDGEFDLRLFETRLRRADLVSEL